MSVDFEAEGLLDGVSGAEARAARVELLERLHADGASLDELREAAAAGRLALLPVERLLQPTGPLMSANELAAEVGIERELLDAVWRALGLALADPDEPVFGADDVEAARTVRFFHDAGLPDEAIVEVTRVIGRGMSDLAAALDAMVGERFVNPGDTELDVALRLAAALRELAPRLDPLLGYVLGAHRRNRIRDAVVEAATLDAAGGMPDSRPTSVCFADLVDFTRLGEQIPADELGAVAGRLIELTQEVVGRQVRMVKTIGDAVMLVAPEPDALLATALTLVERADAEGQSFPQLRAGLATGEAVMRAADWYGRPVNLASRLTSFARPGSVVTDDGIRQNVSGSYEWTRIGRRRFKGLSGEIVVHRVRRLDPEAPKRSRS